MILAVDASAIVAIALGEPEAPLLDSCLSEASEVYATPVNITEAGLALVWRRAHFRPMQFADWISEQRIVRQDVDGFDALDAYLRFGKGIHRAGLNLGDCFAYALAKQLDAPLLYKGNDFTFTDIRSALQPT